VISFDFTYSSSMVYFTSVLLTIFFFIIKGITIETKIPKVPIILNVFYQPILPNINMQLGAIPIPQNVAA